MFYQKVPHLSTEGRKHSLNLAFGKELLELGKLEELIADIDGIKRIKIAIFKNLFSILTASSPDTSFDSRKLTQMSISHVLFEDSE